MNKKVRVGKFDAYGKLLDKFELEIPPSPEHLKK